MANFYRKHLLADNHFWMTIYSWLEPTFGLQLKLADIDFSLHSLSDVSLFFVLLQCLVSLTGIHFKVIAKFSSSLVQHKSCCQLQKLLPPPVPHFCNPGLNITANWTKFRTTLKYQATLYPGSQNTSALPAKKDCWKFNLHVPNEGCRPISLLIVRIPNLFTREWKGKSKMTKWKKVKRTWNLKSNISLYFFAHIIFRHCLETHSKTHVSFKTTSINKMG